LGQGHYVRKNKEHLNGETNGNFNNERSSVMSIQLQCNAVNCLYNRDRLCSAEEIQVQGDHAMGSRFTFCGTFSSKNLGNYISSIGNMNYSSAVKQLVSNDHVMDPQVLCNAENCVYNSDKVCHAEAVQIQNEVSSTAEQTECQTFYPR
jgi:hypothetical protein